MTTPLRGAAALTAAVTLSIVLAACGGDAATESAGGSAPADLPTSAEEVEGENNEADVTFAQGMVPHHRQAVQMSELALDRAEDPEVLALAEEIAAAQEPEILIMTAFLEAWGAEVPAEDMDMSMEMEGMDHGGMDGMAGMMSPEQMTELETAQGADFDEMFLTMMVEHHEGAVDMAETELAEGENPEAKELAQAIVDTQESEIARMQDLLGS